MNTRGVEDSSQESGKIVFLFSGFLAPLKMAGESL
jgi:hypothetical protein